MGFIDDLGEFLGEVRHFNKEIDGLKNDIASSLFGGDEPKEVETEASEKPAEEPVKDS